MKPTMPSRLQKRCFGARTPAALEVIRRMSHVDDRLLVGAGTIISEGDVDASLKAGADFLVTPGASPLLLDALSNHDGVILPGVSTASEAMARFDEGYGVLKFFPAEAAGGAKFLKALSAPLRSRLPIPPECCRCWRIMDRDGR